MFIVKVNGGPYHRQTVLSDGWIPFDSNTFKLALDHHLGIAIFNDLADAQEFIVSRQNSVNAGDYGTGAKLEICEVGSPALEKF